MKINTMTSRRRMGTVHNKVEATVRTCTGELTGEEERGGKNDAF